MSTLELENIKHPDNSGNNIALASNGNVGIGTGSPSEDCTYKSQMILE